MPNKSKSADPFPTVSEKRRRGHGEESSDGTPDRADISKTVDNALLLLDLISRLGPISLGDAAAELKLNRTVVYRLLTTLQRWCCVIKFGNSYVVGPALIRMAEGVLPAFRRIATPTLQRLGGQTRETVSCAVRDGNNWVVLDQVLDSYHGVHVREELGTRYPLHLGAHGYALMATLSDDALAAYYARNTVPESIQREIQSAKKVGYAVSQGDLREGIMGIAATGMFKNMPFSVAVIIPTLRSSDLTLHLSPLLEAVRHITDKIE